MGTGFSSGRETMSGACFQYLNGRLVQTWTSRIGPIDARADQLDAVAEAGGGGPLVAHLGRDLAFGGRLAHQPRLVGRVRQRLLAVDGLAQPHRHQGRRGVRVVGRAHDHGVDLGRQLLEQLAEVAVLLRLGELLALLAEAIGIDVAERDDVADLTDVVGVARTFAADADAGEAQALVRRLLLSRHEVPMHQDPKPRQR